MRLFLKTALFFVSVAFTVGIVRMNVVPGLVSSFGGYAVAGSFVVGIFFTSIFTAAPAIAVLAGLMHVIPVWQVAFFGGLGAAIGDTFILTVIRHTVNEEVAFLLGQPRFGRLKKIFETRLFHRLSLFIGALIIASPLPDELGLAFIGAVHISPTRLFLTLCVLNIIGITAISYAAAPFSWCVSCILS
jgi:hypothetical protein